jgi:hypothetical protein
MRTFLTKWLPAAAFAGAVCFVVWLLAGCTLTPVQVDGTKDAYSGNDSNSGVVAVTAAGVEVTAGAEARYEALIDKYGEGLASHPFLPVLTRKAGVTALPSGHFVLDREHFADFALMAKWAREGRSS